MKNAPRLAILSLVGILVAASGNAGQRQAQVSPTPVLSPAAVKAFAEMGSDLEKLNESHENLMKAVGELEALYAELSRKVEEVSRLATDAGNRKNDSASRLIEATKDMQEMQMSFNLQYLLLQNKITHENRQFTMVSNIMKKKHETAKNAINNVR